VIERQKEEEGSGGDLVWGINPVRALLEEDAGRVHRIVVAEGRRERRVTELIELARRQGVPPSYQPPAALDRLTQGAVHQGVAAYVAPFAYADLDEVVDGLLERAELPLLVACDGVEDPHNLGAVARTAAALGAQALVVPRHGSAAVGGTAYKVSAGALARIPVCRVANLVRALTGLKERGVWVLGTDAQGETPIWAVDLTVPLVVVVGGEGSGMRTLTRRSCDWTAAIPMSGGNESLNSSVAAGMVLYEVMRQRSRG
jgi:23S rRNA (guanosine2251-2'-O)-methyltransferase